ncbi:hypothetical protein ACFX15_009633 [Malus domestica]
MLHMLLRCPWVETIWFGGQLGLRMVGEGVSSFHQWLSDLINLTHNLQDRSRLLSVIAFSCWYIWKARCNYVFKASTIALSQVLHTISFSLGSFLEVQVPLSRF